MASDLEMVSPRGTLLGSAAFAMLLPILTPALNPGALASTIRMQLTPIKDLP